VFTRVVNHCDTVLVTKAGNAPETKFDGVLRVGSAGFFERNTKHRFGTKTVFRYDFLGRFDSTCLESACEAESAFVNHDGIVFSRIVVLQGVLEGRRSWRAEN